MQYEAVSMNIFKHFTAAALLALLLPVSTTVFADELQTLRNMERERSSLIETLMDLSLDPSQRNANIENKLRRLVDLERMVLRDTRLAGNTHVLVRRAFQNYDLTFLAHASVESDQAVVGHWIDQLGLSNDAVLASRVGIR